MKILSIETSCDETALSILEAEGSFADENNPIKFQILANNLISQINLHKEYGGVFPTLAKREHSKNLIPLFAKTLTEAKLSAPRAKFNPLSPWSAKWIKVKEILGREPELLKLFLEYIPTIKIPEIDTIAVTQGPGLEPALWVGINFAKALSLVWDKPLIPVNHMEGHLLASLISPKSKVQSSKINKINFPAIGLLISGGHTELILINPSADGWIHYEKIGQTLDDAVGEAFDKVARMMNLPYPGGPEISKLAQTNRKKLSNSVTQKIKLPRPMLHTDDFNFSFSGLKTAVLYLIKKLKESLPADKAGNNLKELPIEIKQQIAQEFEEAIVEVLLKKTQTAIEKFGAHTLILGGGVTANSRIRQAFQSLSAPSAKLKVLIPDIEFSTDNAVMIGIAGYFRFLEQNSKPIIKQEKGQPPKVVALEAKGNLSLSSTKQDPIEQK